MITHDDFPGQNLDSQQNNIGLPALIGLTMEFPNQFTGGLP